MTRGRRAEPWITDPASHPRANVSLRVAAKFLGLHERTVRARIDEGRLKGWRDGNVYRVSLAGLVVYKRERETA
jgi:excisionase family DNA binding protein